MRLIITAFLALLFGIGFAGFFVVNSLLGYLSDTDAFVATARQAEVRSSIIEAIEADTLANMAEDPMLGSVQKAGFRALLEQTITEEWLDESLRTTHTAAMAALDEASENAVIDLVPTKRALGKSVVELRENAEENCNSLFGGAACVDKAQSEELIAAFQRNLDRTIAEIPASLDLVELMTGDREAQTQVKKKMDRVRSTVGWARLARLIALGMLGLGLLVIALVNASSLARVMRAVGASILVGAVLYAILALGFVSVTAEEIDDAYQRHRGDGRDQVQLIAAEAGNRFAAAALSNSAHRANWPVAGLGALGVLLVLGSVLMPRR